MATYFSDLYDFKLCEKIEAEKDEHWSCFDPTPRSRDFTSTHGGCFGRRSQQRLYALLVLNNHDKMGIVSKSFLFKMIIYLYISDYAQICYKVFT